MTDKNVALFGTADVNPEQQAGALRALGRARQQTGDKAFMKFDGKTGDWSFGPEGIEIEPTELWAINPNTFMIGVIGWQDGEVVGEEMYPITAGKRVDHTQLEEIPPAADGQGGNGWKDQLTVELKHVKDGTETVFKTSSGGGRKGMAILAEECGKRLDTNPDTPVPLVHLKESHYKHKIKARGTIYEPVFEIVNWADMNGNPEGAAPARRKLV